MKKFYPPLVIILTLSLIAVVGCKSLPNLDSPNTISNNDALQEHLITRERALSIKQEYDTFRLELFQDKLKEEYNNDEFVDTEFVWFSLETMKAYIKYLEKIKRRNPDKNVSGIRIYYAAYPNSSSEKYPGNQTSFMVPTTKINFNDPDFNIINHIPFEIQPYSPNNPVKGDFIPLTDLMVEYRKSDRMEVYAKSANQQKVGSRLSQQLTNAATAAAAANTTPTILNEGDLAPPPK